MGRPSGPWGGRHSCSQRIGADLVAAAPSFKHEQRPKREAPVTGQARVLADDALQCFAFEYVTHHGAGRQQLLANVIAQTVLEPVAERRILVFCARGTPRESSAPSPCAADISDGPEAAWFRTSRGSSTRQAGDRETALVPPGCAPCSCGPP